MKVDERASDLYAIVDHFSTCGDGYWGCVSPLQADPIVTSSTP